MKDNETKKERHYYMPGPGKPPIYIQAILYNKKMTPLDFFYLTDMLDWSQEDENAIIEPLIKTLAKWGDTLIFAFDEMMAELLYTLDTRKIAQSIYKGENFSADEFLYIRCVALINSKPFYNAVIAGRKKLKTDLEFETLLSIPARAWARCHHKQSNEYPYLTKYCYETMSNKEGWKEVSEDDIDTYLSSLTDQPLDIEVAKCSCGHHEFQVKIDQQNQVIQLICIHCGDVIELFHHQKPEELKLRIKKCSNCKQDIFKVHIGTYMVNEHQKKYYIGGLCQKCDHIFLLMEAIIHI